MEELLKKVAEIRGMPASLVERSANARATETGTTVEAVLREWAGEAGDTPATVAEDDVAANPPAADEGATADPMPATPSQVQGVPAEITTEYLVKLAAEAKRMPEKLVRTSAEARAKHGRLPLEVVLADWANVDLDDLKAQAAEAPVAVPAPAAASPATSEPTPEPAPAPEPTAETAPAEPEPAAEAQPAPAPAPAGGGTIGMDELLAKVAEAKGMPAALAKRSAEARAKKTGEPLESVLAEWAGVDPADVATGDRPAAAAPAPAPATAAAPADAPSEDAATADDIEVIEPTVEDADDEDEAAEQPVAASSGRYPTWLAAAFLIIPLLAVTYIMIAPNGPDCGTGGQLLIDPVTGNAVNCDGSAYGTTEVDYFANGAGIYTQCQACHSSDGSGGAGPAFVGGSLLTTFPSGSCVDQIEWIALGTVGFPDPTYGANDKPVGGFGVMPGFASSLNPEQIAEVALYERVQFGGQDLAEAEVDCGLVEASG